MSELPRSGSSRIQRVLRGAGAQLGPAWSVPGLGGPVATPAPAPAGAPAPAETTSAAELEAAVAAAREEGDRLLQELSAQHAAEVAGLRRQLEQAQEQAAADLAKQRSHLRRVTAALRGAVAELGAARAAATIEVEGRVIELALSVAQRVVGQAVAARTHDVESLVRGALQTARQAFPGAPIVLHLHPEDAQRLEGVAVQLGATLAADPSLAPGDVRVDAGDGSVWDGVAARLDALTQALLGGSHGA